MRIMDFFAMRMPSARPWLAVCGCFPGAEPGSNRQANAMRRHVGTALPWTMQRDRALRSVTVVCSSNVGKGGFWWS
jgi:hypothetical protein